MYLSTGLRSAEAEPETRSGSLSGATAALTGTGMTQSTSVLNPCRPFTLIRTVVRISARAATNRKTVPGMANLKRCSVAWQGWPGAPGVSQFYLDDTGGQAQVDAIRAFFNSMVGLLPTGLTISVPNSGDTVDESTGKLTGTWSVPTLPVTVTGAAAGAYAGNAGAVCHWLTQSVTRNRRIRGRTYLVPLVAAYDAAGSLAPSPQSTITNAGATLVASAAGLIHVWVRPVYQKATGVMIRGGMSAPITSSRVPDLAVSLRSRRI